jgi:hypothetical protein
MPVPKSIHASFDIEKSFARFANNGTSLFLSEKIDLHDHDNGCHHLVSPEP